MINCFEEHIVTSHLHVSIPADMVDLIKKFEVRETVKIKCNMGYSHDHHSLLLSAKTIEMVLSVKIVVK